MEGKTKRKKRAFGDWGEQLACDFLIKRGHSILDRNFFARVGEIDIITLAPGGILCFFEVKTRASEFFGAHEAVNFFKLKRMQAAATIWIARHMHAHENSEMKFCAITIFVDIPNKKAKIRIFDIII